MSTIKIKFFDILGRTVQVSFESDVGLISTEHRWTTGEVIESLHTKMCIIGTIDTTRCNENDLSNARFEYGKNIPQINRQGPTPEEIMEEFKSQYSVALNSQQYA